MRKRAFAMVLAGMMALSLGACGGQGSPAPASSGAGEGAAAGAGGAGQEAAGAAAAVGSARASECQWPAGGAEPAL